MVNCVASYELDYDMEGCNLVVGWNQNYIRCSLRHSCLSCWPMDEGLGSIDGMDESLVS